MALPKLLLSFAVSLTLATTALAQTSPRGTSPSLYAVNAASLSAAMTYCMTKHGPLTVGSAGDTCLRRARNEIASYGLNQHAEQVNRICSDPATYNTCVTPEIGRLIIALNELFATKRL